MGQDRVDGQTDRNTLLQLLFEFKIKIRFFLYLDCLSILLAIR